MSGTDRAALIAGVQERLQILREASAALSVQSDILALVTALEASETEAEMDAERAARAERALERIQNWCLEVKRNGTDPNYTNAQIASHVLRIMAAEMEHADGR